MTVPPPQGAPGGAERGPGARQPDGTRTRTVDPENRGARRISRRALLLSGLGAGGVIAVGGIAVLNRDRIFGSGAAPVAKPEAKPTAAPRPEAKVSPKPAETRPAATAEITQPIIDDATVWAKTLLKPDFQGLFATTSSDGKGILGDRLKRNGTRSSEDTSPAMRQSLSERPRYTIQLSSEVMPKIQEPRVPTRMILDYQGNQPLVLDRVTFEGRLPLKEISAVAGILKPGDPLPDRTRIDEIPSDKAHLLTLAVREVVNLRDGTAPNSLTEKVINGEYRADGILVDGRTVISIVASRSGRITVRTQSASYLPRPEEKPLSVPPYVFAPEPAASPSPAPRPAASPSPAAKPSGGR